ncbi:ABC transporter permease [Faecalicatena contorta]|uniref:Ribose transport system permease protein n=1 Tax=Faecalicatena contorta TaxID=39482 RepID=A0A315ZZB5_9FIRM|nr:ABC transporter permease [Faecalicatena contorta]PWJ50602.1 ribose transport system permease protein [Faecalicatena contorta]SUQ14010.1 ribose transport system permease protein [Faecalicatena contorta]
MERNTISMKQDSGSRREMIKKFYGEYSVLLVTVVIFVIACIVERESFLTVQNLINILRNNAVVGVMAFGMAFVIISGNIDLSVGSQLVAIGSIILGIMNATGNMIFAMVAGIICSCAFSAITGIIVTKGGVPSFVVTLGLMNIYRSVCMYFMSGGGFYGNSTAYAQISNYSIGGVVPMPIIYLIIVFAAYYYISKHTKLGRYIYAVGSNEKATRLSGINTDWVKIRAFILMGLAVGVASIIETSRMNSINASSSGTSYEMNAIAMVVIGGISMSGGKGNLINTFFGIFILGIINNILTLMGVDVFLVNAIKGFIIILAVLLQKSDKE